MFKKTVLFTAVTTVISLGTFLTPAIFISAEAQSNNFPQQILNRHNQLRASVRIRPLTWSNNLASSAQKWANYLAKSGRLQHSESNQRGGAGENLWAGTTGRYTITQMVDSWGDERKDFVNNPFPGVSRTGNWSDVGHYTQIVWKNTTQVGCALAKSRGNDILVCHYNPAGNVSGQITF